MTWLSHLLIFGLLAAFAASIIYALGWAPRGGQYQSDLERGWGTRRTVPRDYLYDYPLLLGTMRTGPDLINIGQRQPSADWHHRHLPACVEPGYEIVPTPDAEALVAYLRSLDRTYPLRAAAQ